MIIANVLHNVLLILNFSSHKIRVQYVINNYEL